MKGHSPGSYFTQDAVASFNAKYVALTASLHHLARQMEAKEFPVKSHREWTHRAVAVSSAVKTLLDGKTPPPSARKKQQRRLITAEDYIETDDEELS